jgi:hypothetical protein
VNERRPGVLNLLTSRIGGALDELVLEALRHRFTERVDRVVASADDGEPHALMIEAKAHYQALSSADAFFAAPPSLHPTLVRRGPLPGGAIFDLAYPSRYEPSWERIRADYLHHAPNRIARARLFLHDETPKSTIICLHGYAGGGFFLEEHAFPVRRLFVLGLDVVLMTLPFHGLRGGRNAPIWPSIDLPHTNEGFGQAISDLRALIHWLKQRGQPTTEIILCGMSLGGYTAALYATIESCAFLVPIIPVASFVDLIFRAGEESSVERRRAERHGVPRELFDEILGLHTPIRRKPKIIGERVLVISAAGDHVVPPDHAHRLATHFAAEERQFFGGHVLQFGRNEAFAELTYRLRDLRLL